MTLKDLLTFQGLAVEQFTYKQLKDIEYAYKKAKEGERWAIYKLHTTYGFTCQDDNCGFCGYRTSAEITHERLVANE